MSSETAAIIGIVVLLIFFAGDPDLHDAWLHQLGVCTQQQEVPE